MWREREREGEGGREREKVKDPEGAKERERETEREATYTNGVREMREGERDQELIGKRGICGRMETYRERKREKERIDTHQ